jgi:ABC-type transport system involved in multi-copper enzyme maturation permease subunit
MANLIATTSLLAADGAPDGPPALQWWAAGIVSMLILTGMIVCAYRTRTGVVARATTKEAIRQPLFLGLLVVALLLLIVNTFLPFFSLGEDFKMLKDCGLATVLISGLLLAIWTASTSIASEIEGKTAMTLLSKPITRRQFVVGKYLGILHGVLALIVPLMIALSVAIFYKVGYDARESGRGDLDYFILVELSWLPGWSMFWPHPERLAEVLQVLPGYGLIFLEIAVVAAISVAISTRSPMVVNVVSCLAIFVVGHLTPVLVQSGELQFEVVEFMARLIATVLPNLDSFNVSAAVATGQLIPPVYLLEALVYSVAYIAAAILLSFILFEDRDLA